MAMMEMPIMLMVMLGILAMIMLMRIVAAILMIVWAILVMIMLVMALVMVVAVGGDHVYNGNVGDDVGILGDDHADDDEAGEEVGDLGGGDVDDHDHRVLAKITNMFVRNLTNIINIHMITAQSINIIFNIITMNVIIPQFTITISLATSMVIMPAAMMLMMVT